MPATMAMVIPARPEAGVTLAVLPPVSAGKGKEIACPDLPSARRSESLVWDELGSEDGILPSSSTGRGTEVRGVVFRPFPKMGADDASTSLPQRVLQEEEHGQALDPTDRSSELRGGPPREWVWPDPEEPRRAWFVLPSRPELSWRNMRTDEGSGLCPWRQH